MSSFWVATMCKALCWMLSCHSRRCSPAQVPGPLEPPCEKWRLWCPTPWSSLWGLWAIKHMFRVAQDTWKGPSGEQQESHDLTSLEAMALGQLNNVLRVLEPCLHAFRVPGLSSSPFLSWHPPTWPWVLHLLSFKAMWCWLRNHGELQDKYSKPVLGENNGRNVLEQFEFLHPWGWGGVGRPWIYAKNLTPMKGPPLVLIDFTSPESWDK